MLARPSEVRSFLDEIVSQIGPEGRALFFVLRDAEGTFYTALADSYYTYEGELFDIVKTGLERRLPGETVCSIAATVMRMYPAYSLACSYGLLEELLSDVPQGMVMRGEPVLIGTDDGYLRIHTW